MSDTTTSDSKDLPDIAPVTDWATDYDIFDPQYVTDPYGIWDELRQTCPMAHTDRWGGSWLPTRYADVNEIAHDIEKFPSGNGISVVPLVDMAQGAPVPSPLLTAGVPPISSDPPLHTWTRRLVLPTMSPARVAEYEIFTRALCRRLVDDVVAQGEGDAAAEYAQQIPVRVIGHILGVPEDMSATFTEWVRDVLEFAHDPERRRRGVTGIITYLQGAIAERQAEPKDDFITELLQSEHDGEPIGIPVVMGMCALLLIAGIDTTWSSIGSTMWHLATHPDDRRRLVAEPELMPTAIEEFLRAYSPVTMARRADRGHRVQGMPDQGRRAGADELPGGEPRSGGVHRAGPGDPRPPAEPAPRIRGGHSPLRRLEPRSHGAASRRRGVARPGARVRGHRPRHGHVGRRSGARPQVRSGARALSECVPGGRRWMSVVAVESPDREWPTRPHPLTV